MQEYREDVIEDIITHISENKNIYADMSIDDMRENLEDYRMSDSITGNGSGSYFYNAAEAKECIDSRGLLWDEEFISYVNDLGYTMGDLLEKGPEHVDVWARCCALDMLTDEELEKAREEGLKK